MTQPTRIGIVGCGSVMQRPYMRLIQPMRATGTVDVTIACDVREAVRPVVQDRLGIERFTTDYEEVIDSDVDVVMVLTSMREHGPITRAALAAGKHVLVEKPMAVTLEEAAEIVEMARSSPGLLVCAPHVALSNTYQTMWRHIHRGDIGKVLMARARYGHAGPDWRPWF
ncbi:MAG: Gfo/Idh/MocA family oxidoreductase [Caldilineaceae bacterium SB0670_bin_27]|nr:Gfo/Idh/MocA family oxidoreductase [Caldilineaceae bacterium SB0670_bin_27]